MSSIIDKKFFLLEESRLMLIEKLKNIPQTKLERQLAKGKWSVAQVFYHLNRAESLSVLYVSKKKLDIKNLKKTGVWEKIKLILLKARFALPLGLKAPVNVLGDVPENVSYYVIIAEWNETRLKLKGMLDSLPEEMLYKNVFKQPAIGRINIFQMLGFMQAHFNRHEKQIVKSLKI